MKRFVLLSPRDEPCRERRVRVEAIDFHNPIGLLNQFTRWLLKKLTYTVVERIQPKITFNEVVFDEGKLLEALRLTQVELHALYHNQAQIIYCGPEFITNLERELCPPFVTSFDLSLHLSHSRSSILGWKLAIVPWMKGVLVAPDPHK